MKTQSKKKLIYVRYILPPVLMLLMPFTMFIPAYRYISGGDITDVMSAYTRISYSFEQARTVLFGGGENSGANIAFSKMFFITTIVAVLLFIIAFAVSVYCAVVALTYFTSEDEKRAENIRTFFITLIPNRVVVCILQALALPLLLVPYAIIPLCKYAFDTRVAIALFAPDPLIIGGVFLVSVFALTVICVPMEREFDADIFKKSKMQVDTEAEIEDDYSPIFTVNSTNDDGMKEKSEMIRELLGKNKEN